MLKRLPPRSIEFALAWICALPIELAAALAVLDEVYEEPETNDATTRYTLGRVGKHNVVIICLPAGQIGNNTAAAATAALRARFSAIQMGVMVGIGSIDG